MDRGDEEVGQDRETARPGRRARNTVRRRPLPWLRMMLVSGACVAVLAYFAEQRAPQEPDPEVSLLQPPKPLLAPPPPWQPLPRGAALYALDGIDPRLVTVEARRHVAGGREDVLTIGVFGEPGYARLRILRNVAESAPSSFYVDLVRQAASAGVAVVRGGHGEPVATKLGPAEGAAVTLAGSGEQACQALRLQHPEVQFAIQAWICGTEARPVFEAELLCLIDRLTVAAGDDPALKVLFAQANQRRTQACQAASRVAAAQPGRPARP